MENRIAAVESELARVFNRIRKQVTGKGAKVTKVRIADNVIFAKYTLELSELEKYLIEFVVEDVTREKELYAKFNAGLISQFKELFHEINPELDVIFTRGQMYHGTSITTIILNNNLESMIRNGIVNTPLNVVLQSMEKR